MAADVTIAIPDLAGPAALARTLAALARHTQEACEVVVWAEGDVRATGLLPPGGLPVRWVAVPAPFAAPAALNGLLAVCTTPYVLLLESGAVVTPGWLRRLLDPLADAAVGLSGPSTNYCWNGQQGASRPTGMSWSPAQIDACAASLARRFGARELALDTLHSLADFCYLFKGDVARQLGGFDEAYGAGPCWEVDFNTRAARAGFGSAWVPGAYVHRSALPRRPAGSMPRLFLANKQLYQDRFCGLRLCGEKQDYEAHCRGEACEHFAPSHLIRITLTPHVAGPEPEPMAHPQTAVPRPAVHPGSSEPIAPAVRLQAQTRSTTQPPLVSCIIPTRARPEWLLQAVRYFLRQDYPERELIIVDEPSSPNHDVMPHLPDDPRIRYLRVEPGLTIGAKRNRACELAHGEIIAQWDDDDWYAAGRLSAQVAPILAGQADITGLEAGIFFEIEPWRFWRCTPALHRRLFVGDVHGGTLVFRRAVWAQLGRYPHVSLAEDARFLRQGIARGARLRKLSNDGLFVYVRHGANAWSITTGHYLDARGWEPTAEPPFLAEDRAFYVERAARRRRECGGDRFDGAGAISSPRLVATPDLPDPTSSALPLISCIMPTSGRRAFVPLALTYFARQDYPRRELIVMDDGADAVEDLMPADLTVRYVRLPRRHSVGEKRNLACELAQGDLIAHWDDDDWMAPSRLSRQVAALLGGNADVCGLNRLPYYEPATSRGWEYVYPPGGRVWVSGNTLCYQRDFWRRNPFPAIDVGEDNRFLWSSWPKTVLPMGGAARASAFIVGLMHAKNVSPKRTNDRRWRPYPVAALRALMGEDWERYAELMQAG